ncbi:MAG: hypothetical protein M1398_06905 [Deltaproteobacteria bacterium]|jgi:hypothetical protein|nr:hypothetical protein [Deltaproteobacteria bacterium]MDA8306631.1 hypothetical protein [Deltaproteobacteria bacterium]
MRFFIQMGHGMMAMNRELIEKFNDGQKSGVIIWPRTLTQDQIERHASEVRGLRASLLFDSCFYLPYTSRLKILDLPYWRGFDFNTTDFTGEDGIEFCRHVVEYQVDRLQVTEVLLPGRYTNVRNDDWLEMHANFAQAASDMGLGIPIYSTVALGPDLISDAASFDAIINEVVDYPVDGIYCLYHSPSFLYDSDLFFMNLLSGFLSLSLANKQIILGYANQQDLLFAAAGVETIATGNYRNVRAFDPAIFDEEEDSQRQKATWYYDGQSLCEFRPQQLGLAYQRLGMRGFFGPESQYSRSLLQSPNPASVRWPEPMAFKHYITVLRDQWLSFERRMRRERLELVQQLHQSAQRYISQYEGRGMQLVDRAADTTNAMPSWRSALGSFRVAESARLTGL